jgi:peroxiredoxin
MSGDTPRAESPRRRHASGQPARGSTDPTPASASSPPSSLLSAGTLAPDFVLPSTPDQKVSLSELRGRPVILAFYPADWSPVCSDQMGLYNEMLAEFGKYDAEIMGISVDGVWSHAAFARDRKLHFPLLADFQPKGDVSRRYGAYVEHNGESARALFVIDSKGVIRWSYLSPEGINPGANGILEALDRLAGGKARK